MLGPSVNLIIGNTTLNTNKISNATVNICHNWASVLAASGSSGGRVMPTAAQPTNVAMKPKEHIIAKSCDFPSWIIPNSFKSSVILKKPTNSWMSMSPDRSSSISHMILSIAFREGFNPHSSKAVANSSRVIVPERSTSISMKAASSKSTGKGRATVSQSITRWKYTRSTGPAACVMPDLRLLLDFWCSSNASARSCAAWRTASDLALRGAI
mmetsp:Transcript_219/g.634  ORF Transcript_219/g.634 Transcript_219/m.634 type:complete len:212 (-) Transcript_219:675-1310(-)